MFLTAMFLESMENLVKRCYENSKAKGFWTGPDNDNVPTKLMLIVSELSEWLEAHRIDPLAHCGKMQPYQPPKVDEEGNQVVIPIPLNKQEEEAADVFIRLCDLCGRLGIDLGRVVLAKMEYNATRSHMHGGKRC